VLANTSVDGTGDWEITFTATTPDDTQLVILYAASHPDRAAEGMRGALSGASRNRAPPILTRAQPVRIPAHAGSMSA
jgi:hypothetical protein